MEQINLAAQVRETRGKGPAKRLRKSGVIPGVVYKGGKDNISLQMGERDFFKAIHTKAGLNAILTLQIEGAKKDSKPKIKTVIVKDVQHHPVSGGVLHVDFTEISLTETLRVQVKVDAKGEAAGVKEEGGTLEHIMWEVKVACLPTQIPEKIVFDVTALKIGDSVFVKDLKAPEGVKILDDPEAVVFSVKPPHAVEEAVAPEEGEEAGAEEPEVIQKEKKEEDILDEQESAKQEKPRNKRPIK
ncbi:MAG: 50S ribosomal protein L25 [Candidatus Omnitrophota bacterium]